MSAEQLPSLYQSYMIRLFSCKCGVKWNPVSNPRAVHLSLRGPMHLGTVCCAGAINKDESPLRIMFLRCSLSDRSCVVTAGVPWRGWILA